MKTSGSKRIAERYVKALFDVATTAGTVDKVEKDLGSLNKALNESEDFRDFLSNPLLSVEQRAQGMIAILDKIRVEQLTRQFIGMLVMQKRLAILPEAIAEFSRRAAASRGELEAEVTSASALSTKDIQQLNDRLSKAYGRKLHLSIKQDPALLGGMVLRIGSQQLDSSLAGKMRRLKQTLKAA